jgi:Flp pilus assembly pilin Flp
MHRRFARVAFGASAGQTMSEYAVALGVISIVVITALGLLSTAISSAIKTPIAWL